MKSSSIISCWPARFQLAPVAPVLNLPFGHEDEDVRSPRPLLSEPSARPPGSVLVAIILAALSGAVMGFALAGYVTLAATAFFTLSLGLAIGMWLRHIGG